MRDAIISIKSIQTSGEETDTTEIITEGQYVIVSFDGSLLIRYNETEATGYDGSTTTVNVIDGKWLKMIRTGSSEAELLVESRFSEGTKYTVLLPRNSEGGNGK